LSYKTRKIKKSQVVNICSLLVISLFLQFWYLILQLFRQCGLYLFFFIKANEQIVKTKDYKNTYVCTCVDMDLCNPLKTGNETFLYDNLKTILDKFNHIVLNMQLTGTYYRSMSTACKHIVHNCKIFYMQNVLSPSFYKFDIWFCNCLLYKIFILHFCYA
jgi:hypothetical protein